MTDFITGEALTEEVYNIIFNAKKQLLIVSPFIKLDDYFKRELFDRHKANANLHILIAFGKNEKYPERSFKKVDFEYFKEFPNITIVYVPNLHAKYYGNEKKGVITSINLYDYSFKHNVEFGVVSENGLLGMQTVDVKAWNTTKEILKNNYTVFVRRPNFKKKLLIGKSYYGSETLLDVIDDLIKHNKVRKVDFTEYPFETFVDVPEMNIRKSRAEFEKENSNKKIKFNLKKEKYYSATALGNLKDRKYNEVIEIMESHNFILGKDTITKRGRTSGIKFKTNSSGEKWIVYPESMKDLL